MIPENKNASNPPVGLSKAVIPIMSHRDRFLAEYQDARVNLALSDEGYERYVVDLYPNRLSFLDMLVHAIWVVLALYFAFRTSTFGVVGTLAISLGGMILALLIGGFRPLGLRLGGAAFAIGSALLPFHIVAGPLALYGLSSISKRLSRWYGGDLVKRRCLSSEEQFLRAVAEQTIIITPNRYATEDTREFLRVLAATTGPADRKYTRA